MEMKYVTFYQLVITFLVCLCCIPNSFAASCQKEKEKADYWNTLMRKDKVTERRRERHREAKQIYLHCLNSAKTSSSKKNKPVVAKSTANAASKKKKKQKRYTITQDIKVISYHNFKGNKRIAWERFFQESPECINNTTNEKTFVRCSEERKVALSYFNAHWSESQQKLITLIE